MSNLIVDTDVVSFLFKGDTRASRYRSKILSHTPFVSFMTVAELERWGLASQWGTAKFSRLSSYLNRFGIIYVDRGLCRTWAEVMDGARRAGNPIGPADAWIAATALAPLVTHNPSDFTGLPNLSVITAAP